MPRLLLLALLLTAPAVAAPVPKVVLSAEQEKEFNDLWDARNDSTPAKLRLHCRLVSQPEAATEYLRRLVKPSELTPDDAKRLIADLGSEDETVWKRAYRDLIYRDVRLAMTLSEAWDETPTDLQRGRLALTLFPHVRAPNGELSAKLEAPRRPDDSWTLAIRKDGRGLHGQGVWQTFDELATWDKQYNERNPREIPFEIAALEQIATPAARRHLTSLASGREGARITRHATAALDRLKNAVNKGDEPKEGVWRHRFEKISRIEIANEYLAAPAETVRQLRVDLRVVKLTKEGGKALLAKLFSDDKKEVLAAARELQVVDLQLEFDFADLWAEADTATKRCRLVNAMYLWSDNPYHALGDDFDIDADSTHLDYKFEYEERRGEYFDASVRSVWQANVPVAQRKGDRPQGGRSVAFLCRKGENSSGRWYREESAIYILDAIGTDDAVAIIKDMATGHPDAGPTKAAKDVLKRRGVK